MKEDVELDYGYLMQQALRGIMRNVLSMVAELGDAPGEHHFYIEFLTTAPGVNIPDHLLEDYPERMTIVLQHQFEDLTVTEQGFAVTLWFKGKEARLNIPYDAVANFADPSVQFGLRFEESESAANISGEPEPAPEQETPDEKPGAEPEKKEGESADVVSLDAFRKK